jgi:A/G-specific adenine glycosylase
MPHNAGPPLAAALLSWYDRHRRVLPWRALPGEVPDPYRVWLSEVMLQQTTVAAVIGYFHTFTSRWPTVEALADAPEADVMTAWAGLGYYARARNLKRCAEIVAREHGGRFPADEAALRTLPGIGDYTAAAIAAIAFDRPATVMDGNVERVMARLFRVGTPLPEAKPVLKAHAAGLTPDRRPGDYAQAVMDLGATICAPRSPRCILCPWSEPCAARRAGDAEALPRKLAKGPKPMRRAIAFWATDPSGAVLLRRRPPRGLLGGMAEIPSSPWKTQPMPKLSSVLGEAPAEGAWRLLPGLVRHGFTHFDFEIAVAAARVSGPCEGWFVPLEAIGAAGLPSVMAKVAAHAMAHAASCVPAA